MPSSHFAAFIGEFDTVESFDIDPGQILAALAELPDPRKRHGVRYPYAHLIVIMFCSVRAGETPLFEIAKWASDTARDQLAVLGIGSPHATMLCRIFERLDADILDRLAGA